jgi:hypothetical protein
MHINRNMLVPDSDSGSLITRREGMHEVYSCQAKFRIESEIQWGVETSPEIVVSYLYIIRYSVIAFVNS